MRSSISKVTAATVQLGGRIVAGVFSELSGEWSQVKASDLMFLDSWAI